MRDALDIALSVARAFEQVGAPYFLGGSLASSLQGEPRATNDIDFVADMTVRQVAPLVVALGSDFAVDDVALTDAIARRGSHNFFYLPLVTKIDVFLVGGGEFDRVEFARRRRVRVRADEELFVKSPEDTVLRKLRWFLDGGEVSSSQWRDVVAVLRVGGSSLDDPYLDDWAAKLGVDDHLARARVEAGQDQRR